VSARNSLLDGMRVLDAGIWRPVPHATQLLADLGATVLKLEPPGGDPMRHFPDIFDDVAAGKRSIVVDLKADAGRERVRELARDADVFTEGWRPGVAQRLGVGYDDVRAVNPSIIYGSLSGFGQTGPLAAVPGHDLNYQARAGALVRGAHDESPTIPVLPVADLAGATMLALAVCAAWARKVQTGEGEYVDVSMTDVVATWRGNRSHVRVAGRDQPSGGSAGYGVFRCADGVFVTLAVIAEDHFWTAVCDALRLDDVRTVAYRERLARVPELNGRVADALSTIAGAEALAALSATGAPVAPVLVPEEVVLPDGFPAKLGVHPLVTRGRAPEVDEHRDSPWA
jgi:crotonobetainyl-CoA:carnitine CoA-transferase CaiB-like acyl-CoA transferase